MYIFWQNISKFPTFLISVFTGFFLTALYPIFQLLKSQNLIYIFLVFIIVFLLYITLKSMLGYA
uniref:Uncharacterized protein ycf33 n=1 Tax=Dichotomaria marginata TaxID=268567 RepID=A0A1G4NSJ4_9FLOR|nr:Hypothetical protein ycf33 [Dichotomaria marginata]SCW21630.1 Hypothetical protein ycf33 [Dichotomaria marginata]